MTCQIAREPCEKISVTVPAPSSTTKLTCMYNFSTRSPIMPGVDDSMSHAVEAMAQHVADGAAWPTLGPYLRARGLTMSYMCCVCTII